MSYVGWHTRKVWFTRDIAYHWVNNQKSTLLSTSMTRKYSSFLINAYGTTCSENKLSLVIAERILQKHLTVTSFWEFAFSYLPLAWYDGERGNVILPKVQAFLMLHYNHKEIEMK